MKIGIIPYSNIISDSISQYINNNADFFIKDEACYLLTKHIKPKQLHSLINNNILSFINQTSLDKYYIIGECYYYNNWRYHLEHDQIKSKYATLFDNKKPLKYILKERDIKIDELLFNHILDLFFNKNFKNNSNNNHIYFKHKNLSEQDIIHIFKNMFRNEDLIIYENDSFLLKINDLIYKSKSDQIPSSIYNNICFILDNQILNNNSLVLI